MSDSTRRGLATVGAGLVLGVLGDLLLRELPLGLNVPLFALAFVAAALAVAVYASDNVLQALRALPLLPFALFVFFAALLIWRDSWWLVSLNLWAMFVALSLALVTRPGVRAWTATLTDYVRGAVEAVFVTTLGALMTLLEDIKWSELPRGERSRIFGAVTRGLAIAVPLVLLFGALFVAADAVFESLVEGLVPQDLDTPLSHLFVALIWAWICVGLLRDLLPTSDETPQEERPRWWSLGVIEIGIVLALLDLLFLAFVLVQIRYLFGGESRVLDDEGLTYAEYARSGFFELVTVAALVVPLVLLADWALRREHPRDERIFRVLAGALIVLLFVVMASALQRMRLYHEAYGLTELRVYTTGFMLWLAVVLAWTCATVLRGQRRRFAVGAVVSGFAAILAVNALNPDALIARTNVDRPRVDVEYLSRLSDDAVPELIDALPRLPREDRRFLETTLRERRWNDDWRTWNLARSRARDAIAATR